MGGGIGSLKIWIKILGLYLEKIFEFYKPHLGLGQLIPWIADFSQANLVQSVGRGRKKKKKILPVLIFLLSLTTGVGRSKKKKKKKYTFQYFQFII